MSLPSKQWLDEVRALRGAPKVTYPESNTGFPRIERVYSVPKGRVAATPATLADFPGSTLVTISELKRDQTDVELFVRYDTLPGPVLPSTRRDEDGVIVAVGTQRCALPFDSPETLVDGVWSRTTEQETGGTIWANKVTEVRPIPGPWIPAMPEEDELDGVNLYVYKRLQDSTQIKEGESDVPASLTPIAITAIAIGATAIVTLASNHNLAEDDWAQFTLTNSTPPLPVAAQILSVPAPNQLEIALPITGAGTSGTMTPLFLRTARVPFPGSVKVAWETAKLRTLPGPTRDTSHADSDGVWLDELTTLKPAGAITKGEPDIGDDGVWNRTDNVKIPGTSKLAFEVVSQRLLPGLPQVDSHRNDDGVSSALSETFEKTGDIDPTTETLVGGVWTRVDRQKVPGSSKVGKALTEVRTIPGPWIRAMPEEDPLDGVNLYVYRRLQDSNQIREGETDMPASLVPIAIASIAIGSTALVTLESNHSLSVGSWVELLATNSTPPLPIAAQVLTVPAANQFTVDTAVNIAGTAAGLMTPLWQRTAREPVPGTVKVAWEKAKLRTLPGPTLDTSHADSDGVWLDEFTTVKPPGAIAQGESDIGDDGLWNRTDKVPIPGTSKIAREVVSQRPIPGLPKLSSRPDSDGVRISIAETLDKAATVNAAVDAGEALATGVWTRPDKESVTGSSKVLKLINETRPVPGPNRVEITAHPSSGIPILVARQMVDASIPFVEGEFVPQPVNITAISGTGSPCTITFDSPHDLPIRAWVSFNDTDCTPTLDGENYQIIGTPAPNQILVAAVITGAGTTGTMTACNRIVREIKPLKGTALVAVKIDTMAARTDVNFFNENIGCWKNYAFPDFLKQLTFYKDLALATGISSSIAHSYSYGGAMGIAIRNGYRGPCRARRKRYFTVGPPTDDFMATLAPTIIMPSTGTYVIKGGAHSRTIGSGGFTESDSNSFRTAGLGTFLTGAPAPTVNVVSISTGTPCTVTVDAAHGLSVDDWVIFEDTNSTPPLVGVQQVYTVPSSTTFTVLVSGGISVAGTAAGTVAKAPYTVVDPSGAGQATVNVDLPPSVPTHFTVGDIIILLEQPQKLGVAALWELVEWDVIVPNSSGEAPP